MRLLYVCSDFGVPPSGSKGAAVHLRAITRALAELGHEVLLLAPRKGPDDGHPAFRVLPPGCPPASEASRLLKPYLLERGLGDAVAKELRSLMYSAWVLDRAKEVLHDNPPDAIIERLSLFSHVGIDLADAFNVPLIVEVNAPLCQEAQAFRALLMQDLAETIEHKVLARADAILTVSTPLADELSQRLETAARGAQHEKIHVVPNGVDLRAFDDLPSREACRARLGLTDEFVVGFAGSLKPWHGVDLLLAAFAERFTEDARSRLLIVGTGPEEVNLRKTAEASGVSDRVIFTGAVPHAQVPALLRAMDVAVAPFVNPGRAIVGCEKGFTHQREKRFTHQQEKGFTHQRAKRLTHQQGDPVFYFSPIKLFEYMAAGTCVVASQLGQIGEVIQDGVNGLLYPAGEVTQLGNALELTRVSCTLRERLASAAQQTVREGYTWSHAARATARVVERAIAGSCRVECAKSAEQPLRRCGDAYEPVEVTT